MVVSNGWLDRLLFQARNADAMTRERLGEELVQSLVPMIRVALRTGKGVPALVRYARHSWQSLDPAGLEPDRFVKQIAKDYCATLMRSQGPETLAGLRTVSA